MVCRNFFNIYFLTDSFLPFSLFIFSSLSQKYIHFHSHDYDYDHKHTYSHEKGETPRTIRITYFGMAVNIALAIGKGIAGYFGNSYTMIAGINPFIILSFSFYSFYFIILLFTISSLFFIVIIFRSYSIFFFNFPSFYCCQNF